MVHCPSKYLIPIKPSKAMSSRDISDFVGLFLHFSLIFSYLWSLILILVRDYHMAIFISYPVST